LKLEIMKISIFGRPCSLIGFRIYQLSPKVKSAIIGRDNFD
jgi:hypothetical protein